MILKILLLPFSLIYLIIASIRNFLFDSGWLKEAVFEPAVISVGNLRVGGTGKTPHVEYLVRLLQSQYPVAVLSRGYGRKTKGFILADEKATARTIGDESFQIYSKYHSQIKIAVGEERAIAIPEIKYHHPEVDIILLDDAFQHRPVARDLNILLTEYGKPFYEDFPLPSGRLRESRSGASRADVVIVTKCPANLQESEKKEIVSKINKYSKAGVPVFFSTIQYQRPVSLNGKIFDENARVLLFSGVANPDLVEKDVKNQYQLTKHIIFRDHHQYAKKDISEILQQFTSLQGNEKCILTTEKDMVKLLDPELKELWKDFPVFYIPIEVKILENQDLFDKIVLETVNAKIKNSER